MNYSIKHYNLILIYNSVNDKEEHTYITGFKPNSDIIYNETDKKTMGVNGWYIDNTKTSSIEFTLKKDSPCINLLNKLSTGEYLITVKIVNGNDISDVKVEGTTYKLINVQGNTNWIIDELNIDS